MKFETAERKLKALGLFVRDVACSGDYVQGLAHNKIYEFFGAWVTDRGALRIKSKWTYDRYNPVFTTVRVSTLIKKLKALGLIDPRIVDLVAESVIIQRSNCCMRLQLKRLAMSIVAEVLTERGSYKKKYANHDV